MASFYLLYVDDDDSLREQMLQTLAPLRSHFDLFEAPNLIEAYALMIELQGRNQSPALILCDYYLPDPKGADFLIALDQNPYSQHALKVLLSETAELKPIIEAVNQGRLDFYINKPWAPLKLLEQIKSLLTRFIVRHADDPLAYAALLDLKPLMQAQLEEEMHAFSESFLDFTQYNEQELAQRVLTQLEQILINQSHHNAILHYSPGHVLTKEGEKNDFLWFVAEGEVELQKRNNKGAAQVLARMNAGSLIGAMSFITGEAAFSTGIARTKAKVLKLDRRLFSRIMQQQLRLLPDFTALLLRHLNRRLQTSIHTEIKLQQTLNELEEAHRQLLQQAKMALLGQLVAGVAHELNNPVAALQRATENLQQLIPDLLAQGQHASQQAQQILLNASQHSPLSTVEIRSLSKGLQECFSNPMYARHAISMGLLDKDTLQQQLGDDESLWPQQLNELQRYHQVGSLLRTSAVCSRRIGELVKSLKHYARQDSESPSQTSVVESLEDTLLIFENKLKKYQVEKEYDYQGLITCYSGRIQQIWTNLISNAIDATHGQGELNIRVTRSQLGPLPAVVVRIRDNGPGIPEAIRERIFDLNFTTKREGNFGLGIGLALCWQIVQQHNGQIMVESESGEYTEFIVILPIDNPNLLPPPVAE